MCCGNQERKGGVAFWRRCPSLHPNPFLSGLCMGISRSVEGMDCLMSVPLKISERRHHSSVRVCIVAYLFKIN